MLDYIPSNSFVHRLDVRVKALVFILLTVVSFIFNHPLFNAVLALFITIIYVYMKIPFSQLWKLLKPLVPIFIMMISISGFTYPADQFKSEFAQQVLFYVWFDEGLPFLYGGLFFGLTLIFRIYTMVVLTSLFTATTPLDDFIQLLNAMRLPQPLTFIVVTGIRFIPTMQKKVNQVYDAQKARGAKLAGNGFFSQIKAFIPVMIPLFVDSIRMSEKLAISMLNRGYGASKKRTAIKTLKMQSKDYIFFATVLVITGSLIYLRMLGYGVI
ncbi:energy-coupling factor transporter transmembrane component T family protein [Bacillus litorisediminis]|uniref:energy-coupling factor transporter transmembrane component T family protein n=1 Tax=Bacillus litorisediminis TaxID=2922713 RepID=UPI001FB03B79|nr:energy-coupling factor transporter transmembrane component T [Bacillus litorisediminis]